MNDDQLKSIWNRQHIEQLPDLPSNASLRKAEALSDDIFKRIERSILIESVLSVVLACALIYTLKEETNLIIVLSVLLSIATGVGLKAYLGYRSRIRAINDSSFMRSLEQKINVLQRYIRKLHFYVYVFMPTGFVVGIIAFFVKEDVVPGLKMILVLIACSIPILVILLWLGKRYINMLYRTKLEEVRSIYQAMQSDDEG